MVPIPGIAASDPLSAIEISKFFEPKHVSECCEKFFTVGGYLFGQKIIPGMYGIGELTLDITINLEQPPGDALELEGSAPILDDENFNLVDLIS